MEPDLTSIHQEPGDIIEGARIHEGLGPKACGLFLLCDRLGPKQET